MLGQAAPPSASVKAWLEQLRLAKEGTNPYWGALVAADFDEDTNVPPTRGQVFLECIESLPRQATPDEAREALTTAQCEMRRRGFGFDSDCNAPCRLAALPFTEFVRAVPVADFGKYNLEAARSDLRDAAYRRHVAKRVADGDIEIKMLRSNIGSDFGVWATAYGEVFGTDGNLQRTPDETRDRLGLDDPSRFGREECLVFFVYGQERIPQPGAVRPTVLDAGGPMAAAWLPSDAAYHATGMTQNLADGSRAAPEVLHRPFPAAEVADLKASAPLQNDPSVEYRARRLREVGNP